MRKWQLLYFLILFFSARNAHSQQVDSLLNTYDAKVPQEKLHIHFDNSLYTPGETIWYKAYLLKDMLPSGFSKNLYIDWFDETGKLLTRTIAPIINATAAGDFTVPRNYTGSHLQVMAYTKWMLNFDSAFLFHETLRIAQPAMNQNKETAANTSSNQRTPVQGTTLRFFPEGGDMVANIPGYIAFKCMNAAGLPVQVSGSILNQKKETVARFSSEHDGMGKFLFSPVRDEVYTAEWKDPVGNSRSTTLPAVKNSGIVLTIQNESVIRPFTLERSALLEDRFKKITITGTMNQQVVYNASVNLSERAKVAMSLPATDFPSGVLRLTVFDNAMQPVTERILFVNNEEYLLTAEVHADTLGIEKREKNVFEIELGDTIPASLSVSVSEGESAYDSSQTIVSQLLLSSEIKGHVHNAGYYFSSPEDSVAHHLDLVLLTNGWRRFAWSDVLSKHMPGLRYGKDSGYMAIAGMIDKISERKLKQTDLVNMILVPKDLKRQYIFTPVQPDGSFREEDLILYDTTKVYYRLNKVSIPVRSSVSINNTFLPFDPARKNKALPDYLPDTTGMARLRRITAEQKRLDSLMKLTTLKEVIVQTKLKTKIEIVDEKYTSGVFQGTEGSAIALDLVNDEQAGKSGQNVFEYIATRLPRGGAARTTGFTPMQTTYFLDERMTDKETIEALTLREVAYIKSYNTFVGAPQNGPAIAIYTKIGEDAKSVSNLSFTVLPGYTPVREFYSPDYAETQRNFAGDTRRTLYWKPNIDTEAGNKKIRISFYNNDISHSFRFVLEGLAQDGRLVHYTKLIK